MPADFLSRHAVSALGLDNQELLNMQQDDSFLTHLRKFLLHRTLPDDSRTRNLVFQLSRDCFVQDEVIWRRLKDKHSEKVVIVAPQKLVPAILENAHGHLLAGHGGVLKTKERILQSYYWPGMDQDINDHLKRCQKCQVHRPSHQPPEFLSPLPQCTEPNQRVHADLFGPLKTSTNGKKYILVMTDAFSKYVELVAIPDKEAFTTATAFFNCWICRFGVPNELITDRGKELMLRPIAENTFADRQIAEFLFAEILFAEIVKF
jgi:hypothetical protein